MEVNQINEVGTTTSITQSNEFRRSVEMATAKSKANHFLLLDKRNNYKAWKEYYNTLVNLEEQAGWPEVAEFPTPPEVVSEPATYSNRETMSFVWDTYYSNTTGTTITINITTEQTDPTKAVRCYVDGDQVSAMSGYIACQTFIVHAGSAWKVVKEGADTIVSSAVRWYE